MTLTRLLRAAFATKPRPKATRRLGVEALESRWCPAGGQLDTTFNGTGTRTLPYTTLHTAWETVIQPDGKIVSVGSSGLGTAQRATVVRMNADGSLDTTFNGTGRMALPQKVAGVTINNCLSVALRPDGKILMGLSASKSDPYFAVARLNANGSVDTSFGTNAGYWLFNPQPGSSSTESAVMDLALLPDGSIFANGSAKAANGSRGYAVVKLTASGQTDTAFGSAGMTVVHVGPNGGPAVGMAVTPTGGVILSHGNIPAGATMQQGCLIALTSSGQLDTAFDGDGILWAGTPDEPDTASLFYNVAMQGNNIVVAGTINSGGINRRSIVARYTLSGQLDTTFGTGGYYFRPTHPTISTSHGFIKVASDGSIVVGWIASYTEANGTRHNGYQIAHLLADGAADTSYGSDGTGIVSVFDTMHSVLSIAIGPDNKVLVAGRSPSQQYPVFTRFTGW